MEKILKFAVWNNHFSVYMLDFSNITFVNPEYFWLLLILPVVFFINLIYKWKKKSALFTSEIPDNIKKIRTLRQIFSFLPILLRYLAIALLIIALARPQLINSSKDVHTEGIDIVIALDVSSSMEAEDFKPNRLEAAKEKAKTFIDYRINDRIGLVIFSAESFTQCPVTADHTILKSFFKDIKTKMLEDGTAIGMGLSTSISRLKESKAKSKVIILLTDGMNNTGKISPLTATELAKGYGIRVYTIGVGTMGKAPYKIDTPYGKQYMYVDVEIDEALLKQIAAETGGKYFRATNNAGLEEIYQNIDLMEKTKIKEKAYTHKEDRFYPFVLASIFLLLTEFLLAKFVFNRLP